MVSTQTGQTSALSVTQTFGYNKMNRITSFTDNGALISGSPLQRNFAYNGAADNGQAGNVYVSNPSAGLPPGINTVADQTAYNPATNRLNLADSSTGQTATYDSNGNLLSVGTGSGTTYSFSYDAENRQTSLAYGSGTTQYVYDGLGQRVQTIAPNATTTTFVYDVFGQMVADYDAPISPTPPCQTCYLSWDHLGTTRMVTDQNGNAVSRHDFAPFGDELISGEAGRGNLWGANDPVRQKFTGAEQDNQDVSFFQARYYLAPQGRFNSPDPANFGADILNPQSWNGYSYVMNSPLSFVDPEGLQDISAAPPSGPSPPSGIGITISGNWCLFLCGSSGQSPGSGSSPPKKAAQQPAVSGWQVSQIGNNALNGVGNAIGKASDFLNTAPGVGLLTGMAIFAETGGGEQTPALAEAEEGLETRMAGLIKKPVNLPSWGKITVNMEHIAERHMPGGGNTAGRDLFLNLNRQGVLAAIRQAYGSATTVSVQGERVLLEGVTKTGMTLQMWLNKVENVIETAYPKGKQWQ